MHKTIVTRTNRLAGKNLVQTCLNQFSNYEILQGCILHVETITSLGALYYYNVNSDL